MATNFNGKIRLRPSFIELTYRNR